MYICYYDKAVNTQQFSGTKSILLCTADDTVSDVKITTDLLNNTSLMAEYGSQGVRLGVAAIPDIAMPVITVSKLPSVHANMLDCTQIYDIIVKQVEMSESKSLSGDAAKVLMTKLTPVFNNNAALTSTVIAACVQQHAWEMTKSFKAVMRIDLSLYDPDLAGMTKILVDKANESHVAAFTADDMANNETVFQKVCTDKFYISIPMREALLETRIKPATDMHDEEEIEVDPHTFVPMRDSVCVPYESAAYETPFYKEALGGDGMLVSQPLKLRSIIGSNDNNGLAIQDNEIDYYNALVKWIKFNIKEFYAGDINTIDPVSLSYLEALISELYMWHWKHNPAVPVVYEPGKSTAESIESSYKFGDYAGYGFSGRNAVLELLNFVSVAAAECGFEVYPQTVIQLGRWGSRKGTAVQFQDYDKIFELGTNSVKEKVGSIADYKLELVNGKMCRLTGLIVDKTEITDKRLGIQEWPMPVGVAVEEVHASTDNRVQIAMYYSMIDIIREIIEGRLTVDGIDFGASGFKVAADSLPYVDLEDIFRDLADQTEGQLKYPIFRGQGLIDLYMNLNTNNYANQETHFSLMRSKMLYSDILGAIDQSAFSTYSELIDVVGTAGNRKRVIDYMVVRDLLKVYHRVTLNYQAGMSAGAVLNCWHQAILDTGYVNESYFYVDGTNKGQPLPGTKLENASRYFWHDSAETTKGSEAVSRVTAFDQQVQQPASAPQSVQAPQLVPEPQPAPVADMSGYFIMTPPVDSVYCRVVHNGKPVFVCAVYPFESGGKKFRRFIVLHPDRSKEIAADRIAMEIGLFKLMAYMAHTAFTFSVNNPDNNQLMFDSRKTIVCVRDFLNSCT